MLRNSKIFPLYFAGQTTQKSNESCQREDANACRKVQFNFLSVENIFVLKNGQLLYCATMQALNQTTEQKKKLIEKLSGRFQARSLREHKTQRESFSFPLMRNLSKSHILQEQLKHLLITILLAIPFSA